MIKFKNDESVSKYLRRVENLKYKLKNNNKIDSDSSSNSNSFDENKEQNKIFIKPYDNESVNKYLRRIKNIDNIINNKDEPKSSSNSEDENKIVIKIEDNESIQQYFKKISSIKNIHNTKNKESNIKDKNTIKNKKVITYDDKEKLITYMKRADKFKFDNINNNYTIILNFINEWLKLGKFAKISSLTEFKYMSRNKILADFDYCRKIIKKYEETFKDNFDINIEDYIDIESSESESNNNNSLDDLEDEKSISSIDSLKTFSDKEGDYNLSDELKTESIKEKLNKINLDNEEKKKEKFISLLRKLLTSINYKLIRRTSRNNLIYYSIKCNL